MRSRRINRTYNHNQNKINETLKSESALTINTDLNTLMSNCVVEDKKKQYTAEDLYILSQFNINPEEDEETWRKEREEYNKKYPWMCGEDPIMMCKFKGFSNEELIQKYKSTVTRNTEHEGIYY